MQVTCPGCSLNYDPSVAGRCPACNANAPFAQQFAQQQAYANAGGGFAGAAPFGGQAFGQQQELSIPSSLLIFSVIMAIVCQPAGIISFILQDQAKTAHRQGRFDDAQKKLSSARLSLWIGGAIAGVLILAYVVFMVGIVMFAASQHPPHH